MNKIIIGVCLLYNLTACVGTKSSGTHKPNDNITDSKIKYLHSDQLDVLSKSCYTTSHYYDPTDKVHVFINDNGVIGGDIMSQDNPNSKNCVFHPYIWDNKEFKTIYFANSELSRCEDMSGCRVMVQGISNQNYNIGLIWSNYSYSDGQFGIFYQDGSKYYAYGRSKYHIDDSYEYKYGDLIFSPNLEHILSLQYFYEYSVSDYNLLDYNLFTNSFSTALATLHGTNNFFIYKQIINDNGDYVYLLKNINNANKSQSIIGNTKTMHSTELQDQQYALEINTLSNNSRYAYGSVRQYNNGEYATFKSLVKLEPLNNNKLTTITSLPFDTTNSDLITVQVVNDGVLLLSIDHYKNIQPNSIFPAPIDSRIFYLYSSETNKFYKFDDVLTALDLSKYIGRYNMMASPIKFSPNGHYMVLDIHSIEQNEIAVKINFADGVDKFLQDNIKQI